MSADLLRPEEALQKGDNFVCIALDKDVIEALYKLRDDLGFPVGSMLSNVLRTFVDAFLPAAGLHDQGELTVDSLGAILNGLEPLLIKTEASKARDKFLVEERNSSGGFRSAYLLLL